MISLLWKEYREKRLWALALLVATVGTILSGRAMNFGGSTPGPSTGISFLLALFLGLGAFWTELSGGAAVFLYSRPVGWKKIVLAKLVIGTAGVMVASVAAAITFRLVCPPEYGAFATILKLMASTRYLAVDLMWWYLIGFACSVLLPSIGGGLLAVSVVTMAVSHEWGLSQAFSITFQNIVWTSFGCIFAAFAAALMCMRYGVTLTSSVRVKRYAAVVVMLTGAIGMLDIVYPHPPVHRQEIVSEKFPWTYGWAVVSPDGEYALVSSRPILESGKKVVRKFIVRLSDGKVTDIAGPKSSGMQLGALWAEPHLACTYDGRSEELQMLQVDGNAPLKPRGVRLEGLVGYIPSSDNKKLILISNTEGSAADIGVFDIVGARKLDLVIKNTVDCWWQSDHEVGYIDKDGKRIVRDVTF
jgi:hypothetical protein